MQRFVHNANQRKLYFSKPHTQKVTIFLKTLRSILGFSKWLQWFTIFKKVMQFKMIAFVRQILFSPFFLLFPYFSSFLHIIHSENVVLYSFLIFIKDHKIIWIHIHIHTCPQLYHRISYFEILLHGKYGCPNFFYMHTGKIIT